MNWYKLALIQPNIVEYIPSGLAWLDPYGTVYDAGTMQSTHADWVNDCIDFLNDKYNYSFQRQFDWSSSMKNVYSLMDKGWARVHGAKNFEIKSLNNDSMLKKIAEELESLYGFSNNTKIVIEGTEDKRVSQFTWSDYIQSGENFVDFVRGQSRYKW